HSKHARQLKQTRVPTRFRHGHFAAVHFYEFVRANQAGVAFDEIKTERQGQDRDDDHEPVTVLTKNFDHGIGWAGNLRIETRTPSSFLANGGTRSVASSRIGGT